MLKFRGTAAGCPAFCAVREESLLPRRPLPFSLLLSKVSLSILSARSLISFCERGHPRLPPGKKIKKCDLIFNSRSLCEMDRKTVSSYFDFINSCNVDYFYHENSNFLLFPNSKRHIELMSDDFPINSKKFKREILNLKKR